MCPIAECTICDLHGIGVSFVVAGLPIIPPASCQGVEVAQISDQVHRAVSNVSNDGRIVRARIRLLPAGTLNVP